MLTFLSLLDLGNYVKSNSGQVVDAAFILKNLSVYNIVKYV